MRARRRRRCALGALGLLVALAGCGDDQRSSTGREVQGELRVLAAASLTEAFTEMEAAFERRFPGVDVVPSFGASPALAQQVLEGAPAGVLVTADEPAMQGVRAAGRTVRDRVIARNRLALLVERGNPRQIDGLADLAQPGLVVTICAPAVPCGRLAATALDRAGVALRPASLEKNVKAVVAKVTLGEADAGIVYETDVRAAGGKAEGVALRLTDRALEAVYPMAVLRDAPNRRAAVAWFDFVLGEAGQRVLRRAGFRGP